MKTYTFLLLILINCRSYTMNSQNDVIMVDQEEELPSYHLHKKTIYDRLKRKCNLDQSLPSTDDLQRRPLHIAAENNAPALVRQLLYAGVNPNPVDKYGQTPLHLALEAAVIPIDIVALLLQHNADPNICTRYGNNSLLCLFRRCYSWMKNPRIANRPNPKIEVIPKLLLAYGANPFTENTSGQIPLLQLSSEHPTRATTLRIYYHKKQAYAWLLKGKQETNKSQFRRLPPELLKHIIDSICPGYKDFPWPKEPIPVEKMLEYLQSVPGDDKSK